jgi:hypothetical protein
MDKNAPLRKKVQRKSLNFLNTPRKKLIMEQLSQDRIAIKDHPVIQPGSIFDI